MTQPTYEGWLTVDVVEDIQYALNAGRVIGDRLNHLRHTTLPAMVQFRSLAWNGYDNVPPLPNAVLDSEIGKALASVETRLGLAQGMGPIRIPTLDIRAMEFTTLRNKADLLSEAFELFETRFHRSAKNAGVSRGAAALLHLALHEMAENAVIHSDSRLPILCAYRTNIGFVQFCVADMGIGVYASLRSCPEYAGIRTHTQAIRQALTDGVTRFGSGQGGYGFRQVFKAVAAHWGFLRFRGGEGCVTIDGRDCDADKGTMSSLSPLPGFQVTVSCTSDARSRLEPIA